MRFFRARRRGFAAFDMTPMIDVVLQLIIFFMYTSQLAQLTRTEIEMPEEPGDERAEAQKATITIDIDAQGRLLVDGSQVSLDDIDRLAHLELQRAGGDPSRVSVLIRADRTLSASHVNAVGMRLAELGLPGFRLGTKVPAGGRR